ncbi:lanthionine synthetase LanC family protein [Tuwongella immobilis]|uniref:Protein kinase domain-containing protein n=1 Tax=Tuwongella immobilis TaxID=692036 RepID=A0A6C2YUW4_9BACT|nr:lanthionine synthetase LanC family protein [Tuwongella immobilis]VIP05528.1 serine threonine protein kinase : Putative serine/threonine protein kinase OS=uncultured bacterium RM57 PE=4 SV=1: Pkinase: LANC_like [Tuwongella immobilis]VTS08412.1 serine threonine protein kinase : Putative serine/threonine protein kinase OS=uncultured bacterium RM57 PE=4 SV=1: Pkinase: LANC_like [Tuwongella immobilis]
MRNPLLAPDQAYRLSADVLFVDPQELSLEQARALNAAPGDVALTKRGSRIPSRLIDARTANLLRGFTTPSTIPERIREFCLAEQQPAASMVREIAPMLLQLIEERFLLRIDDHSSQLQPILRPEMTIGGYFTLRNVQCLDDTEVWEARSASGERWALKLARDPAHFAKRQRLQHEATILRELALPMIPRVGEPFEWENRLIVPIQWIDGERVDLALEKIRSLGVLGSAKPLLAIAQSIAHAVAQVHDAGWLHGDLHPGNLLLTADHSIALIDFEQAIRIDAAESGSRAGVAYFLAPEQARARFAGHPEPRTPASEQYAICVLLWLLLTGKYPQSFDLQRDRMLRQIADESIDRMKGLPIDFPVGIEGILRRGLQKHPADRYANLHELTAALAELGRRPPSAPQVVRSKPPELLARFCDPDSVGSRPDWLPDFNHARASLALGLAGVAYAVWRRAIHTNSASALAAADLWACHAEQAAHADRFHHPKWDLTADTVAPASIWYHQAGVAWIRSLISHSQGDTLTRDRAVQQFLDCTASPAAWDLTHGKSGILLAATYLHEFGIRSESLHQRAATLATDLQGLLADAPRIGTDPDRPYLGIAHGWSGPLVALIRWHRAHQRTWPPAIHPRLQELAACGTPQPTPHGQAIAWRRQSPCAQNRGDFQGWWCNGTSGMATLWSLAADSDRRYLPLLEQTACHIAATVPIGADLCCGAAGHAYALLQASAILDRPEWRTRAVELAHSAEQSPPPVEQTLSLFKGWLGIALLHDELQDGLTLPMPLMEAYPALPGTNTTHPAP